ncbi:hypothetical protein [Kingella kingae]|nr:hypothetical protein [Kingella kingae]MDK4624885.1 hypothetical protein [Kingella kingae]MDK4660557.1 hypothetical protein [Kingella kingae]MDK4668515.1 hypothetical protein [Kingella kingae]MDK4686848.1 hypothetical protein [Kingella kingae]
MMNIRLDKKLAFYWIYLHYKSSLQNGFVQAALCNIIASFGGFATRLPR